MTAQDDDPLRDIWRRDNTRKAALLARVLGQPLPPDEDPDDPEPLPTAA